jgi:MerR family transcriptional regulator, light-induced transcriptional regulator
MRYLKTTEAAALLNVGPNTLRAWERRFGFPQPQRSPGGHRAYPHG